MKKRAYKHQIFQETSRNKLYAVFLLITGLTLNSCSKQNDFESSTNWLQTELKTNIQTLSQKARNFIQKDCILHPFVQGQDHNLYGRVCIEGKHLFIQTDKRGKAVATSASISSENNFKGKNSSDPSIYADGLRLEGKLGFINRVYDLRYKILRGMGDDGKIPFLRSFLPENLKLFGSLNTQYKIFFEIEENYLVLYKASRQLDDIPYTERTSRKAVFKTERGQKVKYYMVPLLGYPIQYCIAEPAQNQQDEDTSKYRRECNPAHSDNANYLHITNKPEPYEYVMKQDLYPSEYFTGEWFFAEGAIQAPSDESEIPPFSAHLVKFVRKANSLEIIDVSGDIEDRNREPRGEIQIEWRDYKMDKVGDKIVKFREILHEFDNKIRMPYLIIRKPYYIKILEKSKRDGQYSLKKINLNEENSDIEIIRVAKDFWSMTLQITDGDNIFKHKYSFFRRTAVDERNFIPRRWFEEDDRYFGTLYIEPQTAGEAADFKTSDLHKNRRIIRFNTDNQETVIKWHFSKGSTEEHFYRNIAKEAIQIYNRAFEIITKGTGKKVKVVLAEGEDKDLGDLRYNIINLVKQKDFSPGGNLLGIAPSFVNPDTGQIVGTTANIFLHTILEDGHKKVRDYIRYKIFQPDRLDGEQKKDELHVASPYLISQIEEKCHDDLEGFIKEQKRKLDRGEINRQSEPDDKKILISCSNKISKNPILTIILHEMGHSFGLSHNFKASFDENNYYTSETEIEEYFPEAKSFTPELPKSSSIMDYLPYLSVPNLTVLGKYDLAALRFLYMNQFEYVTEADPIEEEQQSLLKQTFSLHVPKDPSQQKPFSQYLEILPKGKAYLHCPEWAPVKGENLLCLLHDHGSTPLKIVNFFIQQVKYHLNSGRYRYDMAPSEFGSISQEREGIKESLIENLFGFMYEILALHSRWIKLRNHYLTSNGNMEQTHYIILENDRNSIERYKDLIDIDSSAALITTFPTTTSLSSAKDEASEYKNYYDIRKSVYELAEYFLFFETMKCKVEDSTGNSYFIDLDLIKQYILHEHEEKLYVENCYSKMIKSFLEEEKGLSLVGQKGMENFSSYYYKSDKDDVIPLFFLLKRFQVKKKYMDETGEQKYYSLIHRLLGEVIAIDPDFFDRFRLKSERWILSRNDLSQVDLETMINFYYQAMEIMLGNLENHSSDIFEHNRNYLDVIRFHTGRGEYSFSDIYEKVKGTDPLSSKIEDIGIPFLTESHKQYHQEQQTKSFKDYLLDLPETMTDANLFYVPFQSNSFSAKIMARYNENLEEIKRLEDKSQNTQLSFLEIIDLERRRQHNVILKKTIKEQAREH